MQILCGCEVRALGIDVVQVESQVELVQCCAMVQVVELASNWGQIVEELLFYVLREMVRNNFSAASKTGCHLSKSSSTLKLITAKVAKLFLVTWNHCGSC